jgi:hypothetical protein
MIAAVIAAIATEPFICSGCSLGIVFGSYGTPMSFQEPSSRSFSLSLADFPLGLQFLLSLLRLQRAAQQWMAAPHHLEEAIAILDWDEGERIIARLAEHAVSTHGTHFRIGLPASPRLTEDESALLLMAAGLAKDRPSRRLSRGGESKSDQQILMYDLELALDAMSKAGLPTTLKISA